MPGRIALLDKQLRMKTQNCENNYLFPGILSTLERARLHYRLQNKHSTMCNAKRRTSHETEKLIRKTIQIVTKHYSPFNPDFFWNTTHAQETKLTSTSNRNKVQCHSLCLPVTCWQSLTLKALAQATCLTGSFLATSHCLSRHLQVISGLSVGKTHLFQAFCLLCSYWYIHPVLPTQSLCKVNQQMTMLLKQLSPRHARKPGMTPMAGLKKKEKVWYLLQ